MKFILQWILVAIVFYALPNLPYIGSHFLIDGFVIAIIASIIFGLINALVKPVLKIITLPLNLVTFGLFALILNVILFWIVAVVIPGFELPTLFGVIIGSIILSVVNWIIDKLLG